MIEQALANRPILRFMHRASLNWRARHREPFNFWIHMVGIPVACAGLAALVAAVFSIEISWYWGACGILFGYFLQYCGHRVEGNDVGEWAAIKKILGLPCNSIAPRWLAEGQQFETRASTFAQ
jgi:hypothetical protein